MVRKLLTSKPATAVAILKHVWDQEYKHPEKKVLMNKYWIKNASLAELCLDIGKHRARKDNAKLLQTVNKVKQKYSSLRQASSTFSEKGDQECPGHDFLMSRSAVRYVSSKSEA